jgi:hypothetical protein
VIPIGEDAPAAAADLVDPPRRGDEEAGHPAAEGGLVVGLDDQVDVARLDRHVADAEGLEARLHVLHRAADRAVGVQAAEPADGGVDAEGDVQRRVAIDMRSRAVRDVRREALPAVGSPAGAGAASTVAAMIEALYRLGMTVERPEAGQQS